MGDVMQIADTTVCDILRQLSPTEAFAEIARRHIGLTSAFDGRACLASVELKGDGHNRKRNLQTVSATGATPIDAVTELVKKREFDVKVELGQGDNSEKMMSVNSFLVSGARSKIRANQNHEPEKSSPWT